MVKTPFDIVYDKIIEVFKSRYKNVVSWNSTRAPKQDVLTEQDLPEVQLVPDYAPCDLGASSCETVVNFTFQVMVQTGDQRLGNASFPAMWSLLGAYWELRYGTALNNLQYNGRRFVEDVTTQAATLELGAAQRGILGWAMLWPIVVRMSFTEDDVKGG